MSSRRLARRLPKMSSRRLARRLPRRLQDVFARRVVIMSSRRLQEFLEDEKMLP